MSLYIYYPAYINISTLPPTMNEILKKFLCFSMFHLKHEDEMTLPHKIVTQVLKGGTQTTGQRSGTLWIDQEFKMVSKAR